MYRRFGSKIKRWKGKGSSGYLTRVIRHYVDDLLGLSA